MNRDRTGTRPGLTSRPWWRWTKRIATIVFFVVIAVLLFSLARNVDWNEVFTTVRRRPMQSLLIGALLAAASHATYSCFDLIGRHMTGHRLAVGKVIAINFTSYAFNLNMGALVGGVAFRFRLYSQAGLEADVITRVVAMSMLTNWLGYLLLAGGVFMVAPLPLPPDWKLDMWGLRILGGVLVAIAIAYLCACAFLRRRTWSIRNHEMTLPSLRLAWLQLAMSIVNWLLIASTVYVLLDQRIAYPTVLGVLLVAAVAGVLTHVPAGLGVLEAVFVALLSYQLPVSELLAALLAYRAVYYLAPLAVAAVVYLLLEANLKRSPAAVSEAAGR